MCEDACECVCECASVRMRVCSYVKMRLRECM